MAKGRVSSVGCDKNCAKLVVLAVALVFTAGFIGCRRSASEQVSSDSTPDASSPETLSFKTVDGGLIYADLYGAGERGVVLAHGGRFNKESWTPQATELARSGYHVLAIDFRGYGKSKPGNLPGYPEEPYYLDVLAAVRHLRSTGATSVSVVGASFGGCAAAQAAVKAAPRQIDKLILLAHSPIEEPERMKGNKLFIAARNDPAGDGSFRLEKIRQQYEAAPGHKELVILEGAAHAQHIFASEQGERLMQEIKCFLDAPLVRPAFKRGEFEAGG